MRWAPEGLLSSLLQACPSPARLLPAAQRLQATETDRHRAAAIDVLPCCRARCPDQPATARRRCHPGSLARHVVGRQAVMLRPPGWTLALPGAAPSHACKHMALCTAKHAATRVLQRPCVQDDRGIYLPSEARYVWPPPARLAGSSSADCCSPHGCCRRLWPASRSGDSRTRNQLRRHWLAHSWEPPCRGTSWNTGGPGHGCQLSAVFTIEAGHTPCDRLTRADAERHRTRGTDERHGTGGTSESTGLLACVSMRLRLLVSHVHALQLQCVAALPRLVVHVRHGVVDARLPLPLPCLPTSLAAGSAAHISRRPAGHIGAQIVACGAVGASENGERAPWGAPGFAGRILRLSMVLQASSSWQQGPRSPPASPRSARRPPRTLRPCRLQSHRSRMPACRFNGQRPVLGRAAPPPSGAPRRPCCIAAASASHPAAERGAGAGADAAGQECGGGPAGQGGAQLPGQLSVARVVALGPAVPGAPSAARLGLPALHSRPGGGRGLVQPAACAWRAQAHGRLTAPPGCHTQVWLPDVADDNEVVLKTKARSGCQLACFLA